MKLKLSKKDLKQLQELIPQNNVVVFKENMNIVRKGLTSLPKKKEKVGGFSIPDIFKKIAFITDIMEMIKKNILEPLKIPLTYYNMVLAILEEIRKFDPNFGFDPSNTIVKDKKGNEYRMIFVYNSTKI